MTLTRPVRGALLPILSIAAIAACSDGPTGNLPALDIEAVRDQAAIIHTALQAPVVYSLLGASQFDAGFSTASSMSRIDAGPGGMQGGASLVRDVMHDAASLATSSVESDFSVPAEIWGRTYVKDNVNGGMMWDQSRTDAPARGVRILLYQRTGPETFTNTVVGMLDVIDSSTSTLAIARLNLHDAAGVQVGSFRATQSGSELEPSMAATFTGTIGVAPRIFTLADTLSMTTSPTGASTIRWRSVSRADFAEAEVSTLLTGTGSAGTPGAGQLEINITMRGHTTRIVGSSSGDALSGTGQVYVDGTLVAKLDPQSGELRAPNGGALSPRVEEYLGLVTLAAVRMPTAFVVGFVIMMHIPFA